MGETMNATAKRSRINNAVIAEALRDAAKLLDQQKASQSRILTYDNAARTIERLPENIADIAARGVEALESLPYIGRTVATAIIQLTTTGRWAQLERMRGELTPEITFQNVPGIGPAFAYLIHKSLHVDTLETLEAAAHDGRLETVPRIGKRRCKTIRQSLASILARKNQLQQDADKTDLPPVEMILDVDREYREKAGAGKLALITPNRFNPRREAWLPILHTERGPWLFTALFSNTSSAHELGRTGDRVIILHNSHQHAEDQCTVVTESSGPLKGRRVVCQREQECLENLDKKQLSVMFRPC
jgi:DNA polymerase (family X)